jgi:hypothetical protein
MYLGSPLTTVSGRREDSTVRDSPDKIGEVVEGGGVVSRDPGGVLFTARTGDLGKFSLIVGTFLFSHSFLLGLTVGNNPNLVHFENYKPLSPHWLASNRGPLAHLIWTREYEYLGALGRYCPTSGAMDWGFAIRDPWYFGSHLVLKISGRKLIPNLFKKESWSGR